MELQEKQVILRKLTASEGKIIISKETKCTSYTRKRNIFRKRR